MSDDLTQKMAEAIKSRGLAGYVNDERPGCWICSDPDDHLGVPHDVATGDATTRYDVIQAKAESLARAALDAIIAQGGVTDEDVNECARTVARWLGPTQPIRGLMARAIATACAERDAEIERLTDRYRTGKDAVLRDAARRVAAAEAQVQRVRAVIDPWLSPASHTSMPRPDGGVRAAAQVRAALDGEADR